LTAGLTTLDGGIAEEGAGGLDNIGELRSNNGEKEGNRANSLMSGP